MRKLALLAALVGAIFLSLAGLSHRADAMTFSTPAGVLNAATAADAEFMQMLEKEDPERYARLMKNIRRTNPTLRMSEDQALTNFMLGLPTGQWRFRLSPSSCP